MSRKGWSLAAQDEHCRCLVRSLQPFNLACQHLEDMSFQGYERLFCPGWVINRDDRNSEPLGIAFKKTAWDWCINTPTLFPLGGVTLRTLAVPFPRADTPVVNGFGTEIYCPVSWYYAEVSKITICSGSASGEAQVQTPTREEPNAGLGRKLSCKALVL